MDPIRQSQIFGDLYSTIQGEALDAARLVDDNLDRSRALGGVAARTYPFGDALPVWNEAVDAARLVEDPATRAGRLSSLLGDLRHSAR
jgi:hypothetical protein